MKPLYDIRFKSLGKALLLYQNRFESNLKIYKKNLLSAGPPNKIKETVLTNWDKNKLYKNMDYHYCCCSCRCRYIYQGKLIIIHTQ